MKKNISALVLFFLVLSNVFAQSGVETCNLGFAFEISEDKSWGYKEPVIVDITPGSPAERAGLKLNDIILSINGNGTYQKSYNTMMSWFSIDQTRVNLAIRNFKHSFKEVSFDKDCRQSNAIKEVQLAPVFAFYSLEDVQDRRFLIPAKTTTNEAAQFNNYRTFGFAASSEETKELDDRINTIFIRALTAMGLEYSSDDPDFIIQTYYSLQSNPLFKVGSQTWGTYKSVWRYDLRNKRMVKLPLYDPSEPVKTDDISHNLEFGYRFYDRKFMNAGEMTLMWESEVTERLSSYYDLLDYLELNLPLMLLKFPYVGNTTFATYNVKHLKYNYTGIGYNLNDLKTVVSVDNGSPAYRAGIRPGDVIINIQGQSFDHSSSGALTEGYRRFLAETMEFRDERTKYTDSNGFSECMYWDVSKYNSVAKAISNNKRYKASFSYLFNFNQYIDWGTPVSINIELNRGGEIMNFEVTPEIAVSSHLLVY